MRLNIFGFIWLDMTTEAKFCPDFQEKTLGFLMHVAMLKTAQNEILHHFESTII